METCRCDRPIGNTGTACSPLYAETKYAILVPMFDSTGANNKITLTSTFDSTYFTNLINQADLSKRWCPTPELKNVADERADDVRDGDTDDFVTEGKRTFTAMISGVDATPQLAKKLKLWRCVEFGLFQIDKRGKIIGEQVTAGEMLPLRVKNDTLSVKWVPPSKERVQKIIITCDFADEVLDENIIMITLNEMDADPRNLKGLLDVYATISAITTTGFKAKLYTDFGTPINPVVVEGLLVGDFALAELSPTPGAIAITSVTENPDGTYTFVIPAQTSGDVLELTPTKSGYDFTEVIATTILIP